MILPEAADAIAIFGSTARGDSDKRSDRDILLVHSDRSALLQGAEQARWWGWSPSIYTWDELSNAARRGSLFLQHLKLEGKVVKDKDDDLRHLLACSGLRSTYRWEMDEAMSLFSAVEMIPPESWGVAWAMDVSFVAFRSYAVALLAQEGMVAFSLNAILNRLRTFEVIHDREKLALRHLRIFKGMYRSGGTPPMLIEDAKRYLNVVDVVLNSGLHVKSANADDFSAWATSSSSSSNWYRKLRLREAVNRLEKPDCAVSLDVIRNPQCHRESIKQLLSYYS